MSALTASRIAESLLAVAAIFVSVRSPRHRPFAVWISLSLAYSILNHAWIQPTLEALPRPITGNARILLHVSQALFLAVPLGFVHVTWSLARVPRWLRPLPAVVWMLTVFILVDGYRHSPGAGLYRIGSIVFQSRPVFEAVPMLGDALVIGSLIVTGRSLIIESIGTDDIATLGSVAALEVAWVVVHVTMRTSLQSRVQAAPIALLMGYVVALGFHAPVVVFHSLGPRSKRYIERQLRSVRRDAIFEMGWRLADSRAAIGRLFDGRGLHRDAFPTTFPLASAAGTDSEFMTLAGSRPIVAAGVELVLSTLVGLGTDRAAVLLCEIEAAMLARAPGSSRRADTMPWLPIAEAFAFQPAHEFMAPLILPVFASLRDMTWSEALETIAMSRRVLAPRSTRA